MGVKVIVPAVDAINIADLRAHLRTEASGPDDALIMGYLRAAQGYAQHYTGRAIGSQTLELALDSFSGGRIVLPVGPATKIESIKYFDAVGGEQTVGGGIYALDDYGLQSSVFLSFNAAWPSARPGRNAVKVRYLAGEETVSAAAYQALLLLVGHYYENREETSASELKPIPMGVKSLLDTVRIWSF